MRRVTFRLEGLTRNHLRATHGRTGRAGVSAVSVMWPVVFVASLHFLESGRIPLHETQRVVVSLNLHPESPRESTPPQRIKISRLDPARLIYAPKPDYPRLAMLAHVQGTVQLQAVIGTDGDLHELRLVNGHPLLVQAAMDAIRNWRYKPTVLDGRPVEVEGGVDVNFVLASAAPAPGS